MNLSIGFLILVVLGLVLGGSAQTLLDDLLIQTEANLRELVNQVQANAFNSCDLLSTCNAESTCSRLACPLTSANRTGYECQGVFQNTNCNGNCPWRIFDFSRSFLRMPGVQAVTEEYITQRQLQGICAQRNLDSLFQKHSNNINFFRLYFGSVDGTFRIFPGMDEPDCGSYDPRMRLWYLTSTTDVKKTVMVLIDRGTSMTQPYTGSAISDTTLATVFRIIESFLNTTTRADCVNIFTFDQAKVEPFSAQPVVVTNTFSHPDFGNFTTMLSAPDESPVPPGNITDAISKVITTPAGFNITMSAGSGNTNISSDYLKVIILITDNNEQTMDIINNAGLPWDLIKNNNISVFLYMFNSRTGKSTRAINASPLPGQLCAAQGYFEVLDNTVLGNPLLALEAYYSFLANFHSTYVNKGIDYSIEYSDYSKVDNRTFTLSQAVFNSDGEFLGVGAIDIYKRKLLEYYKITDDDIISAVTRRVFNQSQIPRFDASRIIIPCLNKTNWKEVDFPLKPTTYKSLNRTLLDKGISATRTKLLIA